MSSASDDNVTAIARPIKDARSRIVSEHQFRRPPPRADALRALPAEIAFLEEAGVARETLQRAAMLARRQGVYADEALLAEGLLDGQLFYRALAAHLGVAFLEDAAVAPGCDVSAALREGYAPLRGATPQLKWLFAPTGAGVAQAIGVARAPHGGPRFAVTTRASFLAAVRRAGEAEAIAEAVVSVERVDPGLCVRPNLSAAALGWTVVAFGLLLALLFAPWRAVILIAALPLAAAFLVSIFLRLLAVAASFEANDGSAWIEDARLPVYTVIIALHKEAAIARQLTAALDKIDYPRAKLDIKFVIEADDDELAAALRAHPPCAPFEILVAPDGAPRTKPRAMNFAMPFARGSLVCVFDAEDIPDPGQLRHAAALFSRLPGDVACLQASLVIDNGALNWKTALFALEYAALFDVFNKGLAMMGMPIFLGGTSNHFRMEALRAVGFWDAFNVTEDADLGLRLARAGYEIRTFASETLEEAPARMIALVKQRTRWLKGWMQTAIVHCRDPLGLYADLGLRRTIAIIAMFTGGFLGPLLGPLLTLRLIHQALFGDLLAPETTLDIVFSTLWCFVALSGAFALVTPILIGLWRRRHFHLAPALPLLPLWLLMLTVSSWRALHQLWREPFRWEKTEHGLTARGDAVQED